MSVRAGGVADGKMQPPQGPATLCNFAQSVADFFLYVCKKVHHRFVQAAQESENEIARPTTRIDRAKGPGQRTSIGPASAGPTGRRQGEAVLDCVVNLAGIGSVGAPTVARNACGLSAALGRVGVAAGQANGENGAGVRKTLS